MGVNVGQVLRQGALRHPERVALVEVDAEVGAEAGPRREISYAALDEGARRVASALEARGIGPGSRVGLIAGNGAPFVEAWFGVAYAGAAVVPVPILSAPPEIAFRLGHADCQAVLADEGRLEAGREAARQMGRNVPVLDVAAVGSEAEPIDVPSDTSADDGAMILYTSGTTGKPKGAVVSHGSLTTHTAALVHHTLGLDDGARVLGVLPLTHSYGIRMCVLVTFYAGGCCVLVPRFDAGRTLELCHQEGINWLPAVPTMLAALGHLPDGAPPPDLAWCLSAGAPLADDVRTRAEARLGVPVRQGYGLTEATFSTIDAPPAHPAPGTVGRPVWGIEIRIVDADGRVLPPGTEGEVVVRGHNVMRGYLDDVEATDRVMRGGWMHTGDVGRLDAEGRLTVVDRIKDLILRGGNNVYPSEVEDALLLHPDVRETAVVGRPDPHYGEEIVAVLVLREGTELDPEDLVAHCRAQLARNKIPREVAVVDALPLGPSRKILKRELRAMLERGELETRRIA